MSELKHKKVKGRVRVLRASLYEGHKVIIRMIGDDYFEYLLEYNGEIYSSYIIITPAKGKTKLTKAEISECVGLIYAGAESTIDALSGKEVSEGEKKLVEVFEGQRKAVEGKNAVQK